MSSKRYAKLLRDPRWKAFRVEILELDECTCTHCGRVSKDGRGMHVHHKEYRTGLMPWEYPPGMLETLCAGCHAAEHGLAPPTFGWEFLCEEDLKEISSECEFCSEPIRYVFTIWHPSYGLLDVGTDCCDRMTGTTHASDSMKRKDRKERFVGSPRWKRGPKSVRIKQDGVRVFIFRSGDRFKVRMRDDEGRSLVGSKQYETEEQAKSQVFDAINSGAAQKALQELTWR